MVASADMTWPWETEKKWTMLDGIRAAWREDGSFSPNNDKRHPADLVSEWVDEPVARFKIGDKVRVVSNSRDGSSYLNKHIGKEFIVNSLEGTDGTKVAGHDFPYWWPAADLRLVAPATSGKRETYTLRDARFFVSDGEGGWQQIAGKRPAIVALIENGQPRPSTNPFVHLDREAANKEARRLAGKHKGQEFGVYELVDTVREAKVYDYEWQRLAASGRKIDAIKRVRDATGFTLKGAKEAVEHWLAVESA